MSAVLRSEFPVLERVAYLNAGSVGPMPRAAAEAARKELTAELHEARGGRAHFERMVELGDRLRERVASVMGCTAGELALTGATTDGVNAVIGGLGLRPGDVVLTSDEEHPGVLAPLAVARKRWGIDVRVVPFTELAGAVDGARLVACSHVSWLTGRVADTEALSASGVPVLLDGAQGLGAVPVDVKALGCDYYAASGQKWLCGPVGSGYLYVRESRIEELFPAAPGYTSLADPANALDSALREGARRFDTGLASNPDMAWALAALDTLEDAGMDSVLERGPALAARLAELLEGRGLRVAPRDTSTLVSWEAEDNEAEAARLGEAGFVVRHLPKTLYVRASVGAWSDEDEVERLAAATSGS